MPHSVGQLPSQTDDAGPSFAAVRDPLRRHTLPRLCAAELAALRSVSRELRELVDHHAQDAWRAAATALLAAPPSATWSSQEVQQRLRQAHRVRVQLFAGRPLQATAREAAALPVVNSTGTLAAWRDRHGGVWLSAPDGSQPRPLPALGRSDELAWGAQEQQLFAYSRAPRRAAIYDAHLQRVIFARALSVPPPGGAAGGETPPQPACAQFSPNGRWLASLCEDERLHLVERRTGDERVGGPVAPGAWVARRLSWSPDSEHLLVSRGAHGVHPTAELYRLADRFASGLPIAQLSQPSFSPDGRHLGYFNGRHTAICRLPDPRVRQVATGPQHPADLYPEVGLARQRDHRRCQVLWSDGGRACTLVPDQPFSPACRYDTSSWRPLAQERRRGGPPVDQLRLFEGALHCAATATGEPRRAALPRQAAASGELLAVAWCPWPKLTEVAALLLSGGHLLLWNAASDQFRASMLPIGMLPAGAPSDIQLRWNADGCSLHVRAGEHVHIVALDAASSLPTAVGER